VVVRIRSRERRLAHLGNHEVRRDPGSELVAGTAAAAGLGGSRRAGREAAAVGQADRGTEEAADGVAAAAAAAAAAEQGGLTAIIISLCPILLQLFRRCSDSKTSS
jgi:hypothetical protein